MVTRSILEVLASPHSKRRTTLFWLILSVCIPIYYGTCSLLYSFSAEYLVQDDARQHVVFLQRLVDPQLFPNDLIADYFTTLAPAGYKFLFWIVSPFVAPVVFAKILPLLLGVVTTLFLFNLSLRILPIPFSAFLSVLILNQQLWMNDDLISATPRAFVYPIFTAFLYYLSSQKILPCLITIGLQGLFFPQLVFVQVAVLWIRQLGTTQQKRDRLRLTVRLTVAGSLVAGLVLLPYALHASTFGAAVTLEQMRQMPEYGWQGRNQYFGVNPLQFFLLGDSGIRIPAFPSLILAGLGLPFVRRWNLDSARAMTAEAAILAQVLLASLGMYGLAHLLLLRLHFPSRYTYHSLRIILAVAAGIVLTVLLEAGWRWVQRKRVHSRLRLRERLLVGLLLSVASVTVIVPAVPPLFWQFQGWVVGEAPAIYQYLAQQPKDILVASLAQDANNLPAFSQRSVLVGREFALPHHPQYYRQIQQRITDTLQATYTIDSQDLTSFINRYKIDFLILEQDFTNPTYLQQDWLIHSSVQPIVSEIMTQLQQGKQPVILANLEECTVVTAKNLMLVDASCLLD